jgi:chitinase
MKYVLASALMMALSLPALQSRPAAAGIMWVSGFYVGYSASSYPPSAIDFSSLTHVMVFSVLPHTNGTLDTTLFIDAINGPLVAKDVARRAHAAGKKAVLVVGGAGSESGFKGATSAQYMSTFVQNLAQTVSAWGFDGVDIDWESLPAGDYPAVLSLISNLRTALPGALVTADVAWLNANFPLATSDALFYTQLANVVDQMNMMTYAMADNWQGWAVWHSSAVYGEGSNHPSSVASSARLYMNGGVPAAKLGLGIGFYGSCWNAPATTPLQSPGTAHVVASDNTMGFANVMNLYYNSFDYRYDGTAEAPYLSFSSATGPAECTFVSYEDEKSVAAKASYASQLGLGGAMIWQLNEGYNPSAADGSSLLHAVGRSFLTSSPTTTSTTVASSAQSAALGQAVTFTALVTSANGIPDGEVAFKDRSTTLDTATLTGGNASFTTSTLATGSHSITAVYEGSTSFAASTSSVLSLTVNKAATTTTVVSTVNPTVFGQAPTLQATVTAVAPGSGTPTGTVTFRDTTTSATLGSASLSGGRASLSVSSLAVGTHAITASFAGSTNCLASTSLQAVQAVDAAQSTTKLTSSRNPSKFGQQVTLTATVAATLPGIGTPAGTVRFLNGSTLLGTASLNKGSATLTTASLFKGSRSITAVYVGSPSYLTSTSAVLAQTVQ